MSERGELKKIGARAHKNSGRGQYQKGDGSWEEFVVDVKEAKKSFTLNQDVWSKIVTDTLRTDNEKSPALLLAIGEERKIRLAVIEWAALEDLMERANGINP
jgi:outer membrane phospholipase A